MRANEHHLKKWLFGSPWCPGRQIVRYLKEGQEVSEDMGVLPQEMLSSVTESEGTLKLHHQNSKRRSARTQAGVCEEPDTEFRSHLIPTFLHVRLDGGASIPDGAGKSI